MTCKDCIHEKVCDNLIAHGLPWKDGKYPAEKWCAQFKPTADVVEVVRCKDCKHLEIINDGKVYAKCTMTDFAFLPFGTDTREHYCGYGKKKRRIAR